MGGGKAKFNVVYNKTVSISASTVGTWNNISFSNISAKGQCFIVITFGYVRGQTYASADAYKIRNLKIGSESVTNYVELIKQDSSGVVNAYGTGSSVVIMADLTNISTISYQIQLVVNPTLVIYQLF